MAAVEGTDRLDTDRQETPQARRFEPWPWIVTLLLASMIAISVGFLMIAIHNPDPVVLESAR